MYPRPYKKLPDIIDQYRNAILTDAEHMEEESKELINNADSND